MPTDQQDPQSALWREFGRVAPPQRITQELFDADDKHLHRLSRLRPGEKARAEDLWEYTQELRYAEIQSDLFVYLLPFCLEGWRWELLGTHAEYGGFVEHFYPALVDRLLLDTYLTAAQKEAVSAFLRTSVIEEIDEQRGTFFRGSRARPYRWVEALTTYGVLLPDFDRLWTEWWSMHTIGRAVAALQYISCLMYPDKANPMFAPWTCRDGGGPPCLWHFEGHLYNHRWLEPNVAFLRGALTPSAVRGALSKAVERLSGEPEVSVAERLLSDLPTRAVTLEARCAELPRLLETTSQPGRQLTWSM